MTKFVFGIEGLDRLGKSTLIEGIRNKLGYYEVIHFAKPQKLEAYTRVAPIAGVPPGGQGVFTYQRESFLNSMLLARSGARIIFDRWHIGEAVYAPMYRGYSGDYVFQQEVDTGLVDTNNARLILLWEDFKVARHFVDDGESLGAIENREEEQERFFAAFEKSNIRDKRMICVTDQGLGGFKPKDWILHEALA
jgi:thymidylate kinase